MRSNRIGAWLLMVAIVAGLAWLFMARRQNPLAAPTAFELYVVGESTPAGEPYPRFSLGWLVNEMYGGRIRGLPIRVISVARPGESIYPQEIALEQALVKHEKSNPGAVLIYSGNNDNGRYAPQSVLDMAKETAFTVRPMRRLLYWLERRGSIRSPRNMQVYEFHLQRAITMSRNSGLVPIVSTVASNLADLDPKLFPSSLPSDQVYALLENGEALEKSQQWRQAIAFYHAAIDQHPELRMYLFYRIGKCFQGMGRFDLAKNYFWICVEMNAADLWRANLAQNERVRRLAQSDGAVLVDAVQVFESHSPNGLMDYHLFMDGHHPTMEGHILLAQAFAEAISRVFREPVPNEVISPDQVFQKLSYGKQDIIDSYLDAARWLYGSCVWHVYPKVRLERAKFYFQRIIDLDPENFSGWLGLGLVSMVRRDFFNSQSELDWLGRHSFYYGSSYFVPKDQFGEVLKTLQAHGVSGPILDKIASTYAKQYSQAAYGPR